DRSRLAASAARIVAVNATQPRPTLAIVGRPNVGKSSLFNRLVGRRQALVRDVPGGTRDRLYGRVEFERWQATVIDTGGVGPPPLEAPGGGGGRPGLAAGGQAGILLFVPAPRGGGPPPPRGIARAPPRAGAPGGAIAHKGTP